MTAPVPPPRVRRSRSDSVIGGVCAGIAQASGIDPVLVRLAVVVVTLLTGGAGVLAYLAAWVLIPRETTAPEVAPRPVPPGADSPGPPLPGSATAGPDVASSGPRTAWNAVGDDLHSLAGELRRPGATEQAPDTVGTTPADPTTDAPPPASRSPLAAADDAATALGDKIRAPEVQAKARRVAASVSQAVTASVDEVGRKVRRDRA